MHCKPIQPNAPSDFDLNDQLTVNGRRIIQRKHTKEDLPFNTTTSQSKNSYTRLSFQPCSLFQGVNRVSGSTNGENNEKRRPSELRYGMVSNIVHALLIAHAHCSGILGSRSILIIWSLSHLIEISSTNIHC